MNNSIRISIPIDQRAALLAGRVLGKTAEVEVSPEVIPADLWPLLVSALDLADTPPTLRTAITIDDSRHYLPAMSEASPDALCTALRSAVAEHAAETAKALARIKEDLARWEAEPIERVAVTELGGYTWERWNCAYLGRNEADLKKLGADEPERVAKLKDKVGAECSAHNALFAEAVIAEKQRYDAALAEAVKAAEVAKQAQIEERAAKRLSTGFWEKETASYNERRYGSPWCAAVSFPNGPKAVYSWGESSGKWGKAGLMRVPCTPGDIIAHGQKDLRRPAGSENTLLIMKGNGRMKEVSLVEAYRLSQMGLEERLATMDPPAPAKVVPPIKSAGGVHL